jgi:chromosome segregation ATPase
MADTPEVPSGYTSRPIPDPTVLTTQALYREVAALKELIEQRIAALKDSTEAADEAIRHQIHEAIEARNVLDREVQLRTDLQFRLVEQQRIEQKGDTKNAVDAALTAQKEAIGKTETSTNKALEELGTRLDTAIENLRRAIDDTKERIQEVDRRVVDVVSQKVGATTDRTGLYAAIGIIATLIVAAIIVISFVAGAR